MSIFDEACAFVLSLVLSFTSMSLYETVPIRSFIICLVINLGMFVICHLVNKHRFIGTFGMIAFTIVYAAVMFRFISVGEYNTGVYFWQWMVAGGDVQSLEIATGSDVMLKYAMYMAVSLFFSVTVFYFSVPTYRFGYLTLISLMPFVLYAKVTAEVKNIYLVAVVCACLPLHLVCSRKVNPTREEYKRAKKESKLLKHVDPIHSRDWDIDINGMGAFYIGFAALSILILIVSAFIPKRKEARYYDKFEDIFLGGDTESDIDESFSALADYSGNADNFREGSNRRLYIVMGEGDIYLKRQVFDLYDFEFNRWYGTDDAAVYDFPAEWFVNERLLSLTNLSKALLEAEKYSPGLLEKYGLEELLTMNPIDDPITHYSITAQNFGAMYYLSTSRICGISMPSSEDYFVTSKGTMYREDDVHDKDLMYSIDVRNSGVGIAQLREIGGTDMSAEESGSMLDEAVSVLVEEGKKQQGEFKEGEEENDGVDPDLLYHIKVLNAFKNDLLVAMNYGDEVSSSVDTIPADIREIAEQVTEGCRSDLEKAAALESYFRNNGFVYDIKYRAPDDSPSYFLTEGKTGTCSDFASAFVLMARSEGLMVRYTEGFLPTSSYGELYKTVTESDSHAYAEVFIENVGWLTFDPTAGVQSAGNGGFMGFLKSLHVDVGLLQVLGIAAAIVAFIILMIKLVIPLVIELLFRINLAVGDPEKTLPRAYGRLLSKAKQMGYEPTPGEFADYIASRGYDITGFILMVEAKSYLGKEDSDKFFREKYSDVRSRRAVIVRAYKAASKAISKPKKRDDGQ